MERGLQWLDKRSVHALQFSIIVGQLIAEGIADKEVHDGQGVLWFTLQVANMVGRLDPRSGKIDLKNVPTADSHPYGIAIDSKGVPIFCEFATNKMAKIDPQTMEITEYTLPEGARPRRMAIDASDRVYFTDYSEGHLGRLDLASGAVKMNSFCDVEDAMNSTGAKTKEQICQAVSHMDEPCDEPGQRYCERCGLWFCRSHFPDPEWHPCAPEQGES